MRLHVGQDVAVDVQRNGDGRVAQDLADDLGIHAAAEQQRGGGVPQVVKSILSQFRPALILPRPSAPRRGAVRVGQALAFGPPAEGNGAADEGPVPADGTFRRPLEVGLRRAGQWSPDGVTLTWLLDVTYD